MTQTGQSPMQTIDCKTLLRRLANLLDYTCVTNLACVALDNNALGGTKPSFGQRLLDGDS